MVAWIGKDKALAKEVEDINAKLATLDPHTEGSEYEQLLHIRGILIEQAETSVLAKIDPNMVIKVVATFGIVGAIMLFEAYGHIFTSKAVSFLPKVL